jgi:hypothetical protein
MMRKPKKESMTFFEMQQKAWFDNDCQGNIEDYDGSEELIDDYPLPHKQLSRGKDKP